MKLKCWHSNSVVRKGGGIYGMGLFAKNDIKEGELLAIKVGKIIDEATVIKFSKIIKGPHHQITRHLFLAGLTNEEVDNTLIGYNHSCEPNAYISGQISLMTMKVISKNEEITVDYATIFISDTQSFKCSCGAKKCRKIIRPSTDWKDPEIRKKYKGYFADYIQREMDAGK